MWGVGLRTASFKIDFLKTKTDRQDKTDRLLTNKFKRNKYHRIDYINTLQSKTTRSALSLSCARNRDWRVHILESNFSRAVTMKHLSLN